MFIDFKKVSINDNKAEGVLWFGGTYLYQRAYENAYKNMVYIWGAK